MVVLAAAIWLPGVVVWLSLLTWRRLLTRAGIVRLHLSCACACLAPRSNRSRLPAICLSIQPATVSVPTHLAGDTSSEEEEEAPRRRPAVKRAKKGAKRGAAGRKAAPAKRARKASVSYGSAERCVRGV